MANDTSRENDPQTDLEDELCRRGYESGFEWSAHCATTQEIKTLERMRQSVGVRWRDHFNPREGHGESVADRLVNAIQPRSSKGATAGLQEIREAVLQFVDNDFDLDQPAFVLGFTDGALALWDEIKDEL